MNASTLVCMVGRTASLPAEQSPEISFKQVNSPHKTPYSVRFPLSSFMPSFISLPLSSFIIFYLLSYFKKLIKIRLKSLHITNYVNWSGRTGAAAGCYASGLRGGLVLTVHHARNGRRSSTASGAGIAVDHRRPGVELQIPTSERWRDLSGLTLRSPLVAPQKNCIQGWTRKAEV